MLNKIMKKFNLNKYDLIPLSLYILSGFIVIYSLISTIIVFVNPIAEYGFNPFKYCIFFIIPAFAYLYVMSSNILNGPIHKILFFNISFLAISFILLDLLVKFCHSIVWILIKNTKILEFYNQNLISTETFLSTLRPLIFILPIIIFIKFTFGFLRFSEEADSRKGIYSEFDVDKQKKKFMNTGNFTCEIQVCQDKDTLSPIVIPEKIRMEGTLIQGSTGTGKTSTLLLPMVVSDLEKKYFFKEYAKEVGFNCLKKGIAYVDTPLSNEEINRNFSLNFLKPLNGKEELFENELKDITRYKDPKNSNLSFSDVGIVALEPDGDYTQKIKEIGKNFDINFINVDPNDPNSAGINPFVASNPSKVAAIVSNVLKAMYESENPGDNNVFFAQVTQQAIENLSILLKIMYPIMHNGLLPSLEDMLKCLHNYLLVEEMCEEMKKYDELSNKYKILIAYFEKNFYRVPINSLGNPIYNSSVGAGRKSTEQFLYGAITQLDNILRQKDVKRILCSRTNNVDFDKALATGQCITVCTRRGRLGSILAKAFGMFFLLSFQDAVLRRPGNENTRIPFFLYIDEFPDFVNKETETCFTLFRKYRCAMIVAIQNLSQLERTETMKFYKHVVLSNTATQLIFTDANHKDAEYWSNALGKKLSLEYGYSNSRDQIDGSESISQGYKFSPVVKPFVFSGMSFKTVAYKTKSSTGQFISGKGKTDFLNKKYENPFPLKTFEFEKYKIKTDYENYVISKNNELQDSVEITPIPTIQPKKELIIDLSDGMKKDLDSSTSLTSQEKNALKDLMNNSNFYSEEEPKIEISDGIDAENKNNK